MKYRLSIGFDVVLIAAAIALEFVPIDGGWLEDGYANGIYAALATHLVPLANRIPINFGDVLVIAIAGGFITGWAIGWRTLRGGWPRRLGVIGLRTAAALAAIVIWFDLAWALNYRRLPVIGRVAFDRARVTPASVASYSATIVRDLNAMAPLAHADRESDPEMQRALAQAFAPVVRRLGDRYDVIVSRPKATLFNWWFGKAGIGGQWDPFAYETIVNTDFLPFERPFALAHEWGHVAGFGDESDANLIAALTTLRSRDPLIRYSGLFWAYGFLPDDARRSLTLSPLVTADLAAARARFLRSYDPRIFAWQWFVYDKYLRANRVTSGVVSYSLFLQVLVGTPLDPAGLPLLRAGRAATGLEADRRIAGAKLGEHGVSDSLVKSFDMKNEAVIDGITVGGQPTAGELKSGRFASVINVHSADEEGNDTGAILAGTDVSYTAVPWTVDTVTKDDIAKVRAAVDAADGPVLIHCMLAMRAATAASIISAEKDGSGEAGTFKKLTDAGFVPAGTPYEAFIKKYFNEA